MEAQRTKVGMGETTARQNHLASHSSVPHVISAGFPLLMPSRIGNQSPNAHRMCERAASLQPQKLGRIYLKFLALSLTLILPQTEDFIAKKRDRTNRPTWHSNCINLAGTIRLGEFHVD
jgi:hypothetical protein